MTSCSLTCEGDIAEAGTVTYSWKADEVKLEVSDKTHIHENKNTEAFTCMMENSVSQMESAPHRNPLYSPVPGKTELTPSGEARGLKTCRVCHTPSRHILASMFWNHENVERSVP